MSEGLSQAFPLASALVAARDSAAMAQRFLEAPESCDLP